MCKDKCKPFASEPFTRESYEPEKTLSKGIKGCKKYLVRGCSIKNGTIPLAPILFPISTLKNKTDILSPFVFVGLFFILPCIDSYQNVDLRTISFDVPPQEVCNSVLGFWYATFKVMYRNGPQVNQWSKLLLCYSHKIKSLTYLLLLT